MPLWTGRLGATKASKSLSCKSLSALVRFQPVSICLDIFVNGLAVTWPVTVVSQGIVPVYRTGTCIGFPPPQQPSENGLWVAGCSSGE